MDEAPLLHRLDELIKRSSKPDKGNVVIAYETYMGAVTIASLLYGNNSPQMSELKAERQRLSESKWAEGVKFKALVGEIHGILKSFRADANAGLLSRIEEEAQADVYASFVTLAKDCLENDHKQAAAVLASAALEDALKKFGTANELDVEDLDMSAVIARLKSAGLLKKAEAKVVQSYVTLRNKAMHAEWDKIGEPEIAGAIGFAERFVLTRFVQEDAEQNDAGD